MKVLSSFALLIFLYTEISANFLRDNLSTGEKIGNFPEPPHCGFGKTTKTSNRVHGGIPVKPHELPWMVFFSHGCGGTLINSRWVLTAAHCFYPRNFLQHIAMKYADAFIAAQDCHSQKGYCDSKARKVEIKKKILHEKFDPLQTYNDIALIKLKKTIKFNDKIQPICLPYNNQASGSSLFGKEVETSGWGKTEHDVPSVHLLKVGVKVWDANRCEAFEKIFIDNRLQILKSELEICAGGIAGKDACSGDSGGPLYSRLLTSYENETSKPYYQVGIVSFGDGCGKEGYPGVYTNLTTYIPWIRKKILSN